MSDKIRVEKEDVESMFINMGGHCTYHKTDKGDESLEISSQRSQSFVLRIERPDDAGLVVYRKEFERVLRDMGATFEYTKNHKGEVLEVDVKRRLTSRLVYSRIDEKMKI